MEGYVDVYTFPKNITVVLKSSESQGISAENKAKIEAPDGYGSSVYNWVYRTSPYETWQPIANASLNGNRILEASLQDIYGAGFMNNGVVDFSSNTYIALEYNVYKSSSNVKDKEYSNIIPLSNKLIAPKIVSATGGKTLCPGQNNGKITVVIDRPLFAGKEMIAFFAYTSDGIRGDKRDYNKTDDTTYEITGLIASNYTVETGSQYNGASTGITDAGHKRIGVTVTEPDPVSYTVNETDKKHISCKGGDDGFFKVTAGGGTGPYTLWWEADGASGFNPVADNLLEVSGLEAGMYRYYVTDLNNCELEDPEYGGILYKTVTLTEPVQSPAISLLSGKTAEPTGNGRSDGYITVKISGGTPSYTVVWQEKISGVILSTVDNGTEGESKLYNIPSGTYTVTVTDSKGCTLSAPAEFTLDEPDALKVTINRQGQILCYGDASVSLTVSVSGGIGETYTYVWSKKTNGVYVQISTNSYLNNLGAGDYKILVSDGSTSPNTAESVIAVSQPPLLETSVVGTKDVSCFGGSDGYIHISVTGGFGSYRLYYKLNGTDTDYREIDGGSQAYTFLLNNLPAGVYSVYVLDENSCYAAINGANIAEIVLNQPDKALNIVTDTVYDPTANGLSNGKIYVQLDGGTPEYRVIWRDSKGNALTAQNSVVDGVFSSALTGLGKGKYMIEVRDANYPKADNLNNTACILVKEYELFQPEELTLNLEETHYISCYQMSDGEITAYAKGGVRSKEGNQLPYKYTWYREEAGNFVVMPGWNDSVLTNIPAGTYQLAIEDYARIPNRISVVYQIVQPGLLTATTEDIRVVCGETATISVAVSGGTIPYTYKWNTGDSSPEVNDMTPGKYMVIVTDARGCEATAIAKVISPSDLSVSATVNHPVCRQAVNGSIIIQVTGGTAPYTYLWSTGETTKDSKNIGAGMYTVVVTDKDGCSLSESFELTDPEPVKVDLGEDLTLCTGRSYLLEPEVEDPKTEFSWTGPDEFQSKDPKVELSRAGTYRLIITDSKGCQATDDIEVFLTDYSISSEMVVATEMLVNDTIVLVNISSPDPERIEWLFPENDPVEIVETSFEMVKIIFRQAGEYAVGMRSYVKDCYQDMVKTLDVKESDGSNSDGFVQTDILEFTVNPNPNNGNFKVKVELGKQGAVRLRLFSLLHGNIMDDRTLSGSNLYEESYQMYLASGVYVLLLETASGRRSQKIIIY
jgi:hypothetical protein